MNGLSRAVMTAVMLILPLFFAAFAAATEARALFVFNPANGEIAEYGAGDFKQIRSLNLPPDFLAPSKGELAAKGLYVSSSGRILYYLDERGLDGTTVTRRFWYWDGSHEQSGEVKASLDVNDELTAPVLDAHDTVAYWGINRAVAVHSGPLAIELRFDLYRVRFIGAPVGGFFAEQSAAISFDECACLTGVCQETCQYGGIYAEAKGVTDVIDVAHIVRGQIETSVVGHTYLERATEGRAELAAARSRPSSYLLTGPDGACCGWSNESSDSVTLVTADGAAVIYDEWKHFSNRNYDINFGVSDAELSPDGGLAAFTVFQDERSLSEYAKTGVIRLSPDGKEDPNGLEYIEHILNDMPEVEILLLNSKPAGAVTINNASFAGWIDNVNALVLKDGRLQNYNVEKRAMTDTLIETGSVKNVFLR